MGVEFQSVASVAPFLIHGLGINYAQIGTLIGLFMLPGAFVSLPAGLIGRHVGDRLLASAALALMAGGGAVVGLSHAYAIAFAGRLAAGIGSALLNIALTKMVTDWFAERGLVLAMGIVLASWPLGIAAGLFLQPGLAATHGWRWVMFSAAGFAALAMILIATCYREPRASGRKKRKADKAAATPLQLPPLAESLSALVAGAMWGSYNIGLVVFFSFTPLLLVEHGALPVAAASATSLALWISVLSLPLGGYLIQRLGHANAAIIGFCFISAWALAMLPSGLWPLGLSAVLGIALGPPAGAIMSLPARALSLKHRAAGLGLFFSIHYTLTALGPAVAGWLRDQTGSSAAAIFFGAAFMLLVLPLLRLFERRLEARG